MPVAQPSSSDSSVGAVSPRSVCVISRLRSVVERQIDQVARAFDLEFHHVHIGAALRALGVRQQRGGGGVRQRAVVGTVAGKVRHLQRFAQLAASEGGVELPRWPHGASRDTSLQRWRHVGLVEQHLGRLDARQPRRQFVDRGLREHATPAGQAQPRQAPARAARIARQRQQRGVAALGEQLAVGHGARRDDACHPPFDRALGGGDVAHLLGDGHRLAELDQAGEVGLERMHRHTGHHHRLAGTGAARGERDVEQPVGAPRVVVEQLVEVAHPVQHQDVGMLGLDAQVLLHHRRVGQQIGG